MPEPAPKTYPALTDPVPQAIVIHCGDPRFQPAFRQFIAEDLHLADGQYVPIVVGGGAGVLAHPEQLPKEFKFLKERLELYSTRWHSIRRVVLISHENCGYYAQLKQRVFGFAAPHHRPQGQPADDLRLLGPIFARLLAHLGLQVELYYAHFADEAHSQVVFDAVRV